MSSESISKLQNLLDISKKIDTVLLASKYFDLDSRSYLLKSLEGVMQYAVIAQPKTQLNSGRSISFNKIPLRGISVMSSPGFRNQSESISTSGNLTRTFVLNPMNLDPNSKELSFRFDIPCDVEPITKDLVRRDHQIETSSDENNRYWLSAEIKELGKVVPLLRRMELSDIPFAMNVAVHQDVKMKFPARRQKELELIAKWARENDRNKKNILSYEHMQVRSARPKEKDITSILVDLETLFMPHHFCSFIDVLKDFHYSECFRGAEFYEQIPFRTFPKWMSVISRTNVSTDKPASEGELIYKKGEFQEAVEEAITRK